MIILLQYKQELPTCIWYFLIDWSIFRNSHQQRLNGGMARDNSFIFGFSCEHELSRCGYAKCEGFFVHVALYYSV